MFQSISGSGTVYERQRGGRIVEVASGDWYFFTAHGGYWRKSTDKGRTWSAPTFFEESVQWLDIWYDRWTPGNTTGNLIHVAWIDATDDDVQYANLNVTNDSWTGPVVVFAGVSMSVVTGGGVSITRTKGGNILVIYNGDGGTEEGAAKSTDGGVNFAAITNPNEASTDWFKILPGNFADNQDAVLIYFDWSSDEISYKIYDDSLNSWAETVISIGVVEGTSLYPQFDAIVRHSDEHIIVACWNNVDVVTADLRTWDIIPGTSGTAKANVHTDVDDCAAVALMINLANDFIYAFHLGKGDGSETIGTTAGIYYDYTDDALATWETEVRLTDYSGDPRFITCCPYMLTAFPVLPVVWWDTDMFLVMANGAGAVQPTYMAGLG